MVFQTYPPYKNLVPEIPRLSTKKIRELGSKIVFSLPGCFCFSVVAPLDLEVLDGAASGATLGFIQNANWPLTISEVWLKVDGLMIGVLVEVRAVGNLETLPEL